MTWRTRIVAVAWLGVLACRPEPGPAPVETAPETETGTPTPTPTGTTGSTTFEANFLWSPLELDGALDLGHVPAPVTDPVEPGPIVLTEVGVEAGLGGSRAGGNVYGVGLAFVDVDADGFDDLLVVNGAGPAASWDSALWRNLGDGTFEDVTAASGIGAVLAGRDGTSVAAGDLDVDGDVDLYVGAHPADVLLHGLGDGTFVDATEATGAAGPTSVAGDFAGKLVGVGDHDGDGLLDLASASDAFEGGLPNLALLRGTGGGGFTDMTASSGAHAPDEGTPCAMMWTDHDADGRADLAIWSDLGDPATNRVLLRSDGATLSDVAPEVGWTTPVGMPMGIDAADVDRDGGLDYYVGNAGPNLLLLSGDDGTWLDWAQAAGITASNAWGVGFEDLDADGWWDVFVGQTGSLDHLAMRHLRTVPPTFEEVEVSHDFLIPGNVPVVFADYDRDGDVDVAVGNVGGGRVDLFRNDTDRGTARSLEVRVEAAPGDGAVGAVGARVVVSAGGVVLWRDITGGSSRGSQNALSARFGLGQHTGAEWVAVLWPDGRQVAARNVPGDSRLVFAAAGPELR